jgi:hypothetical protein
MTITVEMLEDAGACSEQVEIFGKEWPEGVEVTEINITRAVELGLELHWAALHLLNEAQGVVFRKLKKEAQLVYNKGCEPAHADYGTAVEAAMEDLSKQREAIFSRYSDPVSEAIEKKKQKELELAAAAYDNALSAISSIFTYTEVKVWDVYLKAIAAAFLSAADTAE